MNVAADKRQAKDTDDKHEHWCNTHNGLWSHSDVPCRLKHEAQCLNCLRKVVSHESQR